jgi:superfamily II DNA helicase RecQ
VGPGTVAAFLIGSGSASIRKWELQTKVQFGVLKHRREDWTRRLLRRLLAAGLLALEPEQQTLHLTRRGAEVISESRPNPVRLPPLEAPTKRVGVSDGRSATAALDGIGIALYERLKQWRRLRADAEEVPAYVICHDATLAAIAQRRPTSSEELLEVPGMGPAKLKRYGVQLLEELRNHYAEHPESREHPSAAEGPGPLLETPAAAEGDGTVYEALKAWRRKAAVAAGLKLWQVATNEALVAIAEQRPSSIGELGGIGVLDEGQLARFGQAMLDVSGEGRAAVPEHLRVANQVTRGAR